MENVNFFQSWVGNIVAIFADFRFVDFLDICLVTFLIYNAIKLIRETRTMQLIKGLLLLGVVYIFVAVLDMGMSTFLFNSLFRNVILVIIVVFQPEIRHVFETMGRSRFKSVFGIHTRTAEIRYNEETSRVIDEICRACTEMSDRKIGVLLVMERETMLGEIVQTGTPVDAKVSEELIENVFYPKAPLHDGAAVIRDNRLFAAGCILPLTQDHSAVSSELGTRHRAAIGMSEQSDALVVVVSEETGNISIAQGGKLQRNISVGDLREFLDKELLIAEPEDNKIKLRNLFGGKQK